MVLAEEKQLERRLKRSREDEDNDKGTLIFKHLKIARVRDIGRLGKL